MPTACDYICDRHSDTVDTYVAPLTQNVPNGKQCKTKAIPGWNAVHVLLKSEYRTCTIVNTETARHALPGTGGPGAVL